MAEENKTITLADLKKHNKEGDMWIAVHGDVYDLSKFDAHPGGQDVLIENAGKDATDVFDEAEHSSTDKKQLKQYLIGKLEGYVEKSAADSDGLRHRKTNAVDDQVGGGKNQSSKEQPQSQTNLVIMLFVVLAILMGAKYLFDSM